ncbi:hypothetical protein D3C81_2161280 [compost metagenome]
MKAARVMNSWSGTASTFSPTSCSTLRLSNASGLSWLAPVPLPQPRPLEKNPVLTASERSKV